MRYLYHVASKIHKESILKNGLVVSKNYFDTETINAYLEEYKPVSVTFDRSRCLFFYTRLKDCVANGSNIYRVNPKDLDLTKLYVAEYTYAHYIWQNLVDAPYTGEYAPIPTEESAKLYWESLRPYHEYLKHKKEYRKPECMYLGNIPPSKLILLK